MKKLLLTAFLVAATILGIGTTANAAVIKFDDLSNSTFVYDGYEGFNWNNFISQNADNAAAELDSPDLYNADESFPNVAWNNAGSPADMSSDRLFILNSGYFTAWAPDLFTLRIQAFRYDDELPRYDDELPVSTKDISLLGNQKKYFNFDFQAANEIRFTPLDANGNPVQEGEWFAMDNIDYTTAPVPEPSSMVLGIMGIASLLGFRKKQTA